MNTMMLAALTTLVISTGLFHDAKAEHPKNTEHQAQESHAANDLVAVATGAGHFSTLITAITAAGLLDELHGKGPYTIFAPTDEAFAKLPAGTLENLLEPANKAMLAGLLANHVVPGIIETAEMKTMKAVNISGQDLVIQIVDGVVTVNNARVVQADLIASNGVIHAIDAVIAPSPPAHDAASEKPKDHPAH